MISEVRYGEKATLFCPVLSKVKCEEGEMKKKPLWLKEEMKEAKVKFSSASLAVSQEAVVNFCCVPWDLL